MQKYALTMPEFLESTETCKYITHKLIKHSQKKHACAYFL